MPPKKKSGLKTRKRVKKTEEYLPFINDVPQWDDPEKTVPKAEVVLTYAHGVNELFGSGE